MRVIHKCLLLTAASLTGVVQCVASGQNSKAPFTLTISVNPSNASQTDTGNKTLHAGSGVTVRIQKKNVADREIPKLGPENGPFGYVFDVRGGNGNPVPPPHRPARKVFKGGGPAIIRGTKDAVLQPGESWTIYAPVSEWFDLSQPGRYTIQVSQRVSSAPNSPVVKSNKITLTVVP